MIPVLQGTLLKTVHTCAHTHAHTFALGIPQRIIQRKHLHAIQTILLSMHFIFFLTDATNNPLTHYAENLFLWKICRPTSTPHAHGLTSMPSCVASTATLASSSGSASASRKARAPRAWPMFPRQTRATSSRRFFTHIRAMFSHTASLQGRRDNRGDRNVTWFSGTTWGIIHSLMRDHFMNKYPCTLETFNDWEHKAHSTAVATRKIDCMLNNTSSRKCVHRRSQA